MRPEIHFEMQLDLPRKVIKNTWNFLSNRDALLTRFYLSNIKNNNPINNSGIGSESLEMHGDNLPPEPNSNPDPDNTAT
jgi:hypothetical protein